MKTLSKQTVATPYASKLVLLLSLMLCACALMVAMPATALAAGQSGTYVFDEQGLFTDDQFASLEAKAQELTEKYNMGVYVWTTDVMNETYKSDSEEEATRKRVTENFYRSNNLGLGENHDGIILAIASVSREYDLGGLGQGSYSFSDKGIAEIKSDVKSRLSSSDWYGGAQVYLADAGEQLAYYDAHGKPYAPLSLTDWLIRLFIVLGIPFIVTYSIVNSWRKAMLTAVEKSEAGNYLDANSVKVTRANDQFVNTTLVATPRPKNNNSGGGGWGGGGGGGFSSSGGRF